jgi:hypothetical protein
LASILALAGVADAQMQPPGGVAHNIRHEAARLLPLDKLEPSTKVKVTQAVNQADIFRRLPTQVIECNPDLYLFLIRNPEIIVNIWQLMGVSKVTMDRRGPTMFEASDHAGSRCTISIVYSDHETVLVYAEGAYEGPLFNRALRAKCVLLIKSAYVRETDNKDYVTCRMDVFINIENAGVDILAKTFQPLITKSADYNFQEIVSFVSLLSKTSERNPQGIGRLAAKCTGADPEIRNQFATLAQQTAEHAVQRHAQVDAAEASRPVARSAQTR